MKSRIVMVIGIGLLVIGISIVPAMESKAAMGESQLTHDTQSRGEMIKKTRGAYLDHGETMITNLGLGKVGLMGSTTATMTVDYIQVGVIVERWIRSEDRWQQIDYFYTNGSNTYYLNTEKILFVERGYYYRARGLHSAATDMGYSYTNGIWMG